jgi:hypothetical protein
MAKYENTEAFKSCLENLEALANKLEYPEWAKRFHDSYTFLCGDKDIEEFAQRFPEVDKEDINVYLAARTAHVFGGCGWWNDGPKETAYFLGFGDEYNDATNELRHQLHLASAYGKRTFSCIK